MSIKNSFLPANINIKTFCFLIGAVVLASYYVAVQYGGMVILNGDCYTYHEVADLMLDGSTIFKRPNYLSGSPSGKFGFLPSLVAAIVSKLTGSSTYTSFMWCNGLCFLINMILFYRLTSLFSSSTRLVLFCFFSFAHAIVLYLEISSEPLYMVFNLLILNVLCKNKDISLKDLAILSILAGFSYWTRHAGFSWFIFLCLYIVIGPDPLKTKIQKCTLVMAISSLFLGIFWLRINLFDLPLTDRHWLIHFDTYRKILSAPGTIISYFYPIYQIMDLRWYSIIIFTFTLVPLAFLTIYKTNISYNFINFRFGFYLSIYLVFLVVVWLFIDKGIVLDTRLLYPSFPIFLYFFGISIETAAKSPFHNAIIKSTIILSIVCICYNFFFQLKNHIYFQANTIHDIKGIELQLMNSVQTKHLIISNVCYLFYPFGKKDMQYLPNNIGFATGLKNTNVEMDLEFLRSLKKNFISTRVLYKAKSNFLNQMIDPRDYPKIFSFERQWGTIAEYSIH